ncbi:MAG: FKBP-type peptidyl-prolyl cis-trans isomerase [Cyclobacteriaceae bacterium]|nr:FKBP-type peptidyl-prolyl cis-trans isomerase [Cyclobacteriaceae bacterium]
MIIEKNTVVAISYSMRNENDNLLEDNDGYAPIVYLQGAGNIMHELEVGLQGLKAGDTKEIIVANSVTNLVHAGSESSALVEGTLKSENVRFTVKVVSVREASPAEIAAGFPLPESSCGCKPGCC